MPNGVLPKGGNSFRMCGSSGFRRALSNLTRRGSYSNLKNNEEAIIRIFSGLRNSIRRNGKLSLMERSRAARAFSSSSNTTRQDIRDFRKILDAYK